MLAIFDAQFSILIADSKFTYTPPKIFFFIF